MPDFLKSAETGNPQKNADIRKAFLDWLLCLSLLIGLIYISSYIAFSFFDWLIIVYYLSAGVYLNRYALRKIVTWHPVYDTLENVSVAKFRLFLFWPVTYCVLFARIGITKML